MRRPKIVVVGAGPSGGAFASALGRRKRFEVILLDKSTYPRVKVCGSGLSPHALAALTRLGLRDALSRHFAPIHKLDVVGPAGGRLRLDSGSGGAWVVPRVELDHTVVRSAIAEGVDFREDHKVTALMRDARGDVHGVKTSQGDLEADLVILANGSPSRFERETTAPTAIRTIMGWWEGATLDHGVASMIWDRRLDGYYAWAFPEPEGIVNIGLTIPEGAPQAARLKELFQELLDEHYGEMLRGATQARKWMGHPATVATSIGDIAEGRAMWIGEAARLVSPGTVEGISFALHSGLLAADFVAHHFEAGTGWSNFQIQRYRAGMAAKMLPWFVAGAALERGIRSELMQRTVGSFVTGPAGRAFGRAVKWLMGTETPRARVPTPPSDPRVPRSPANAA